LTEKQVKGVVEKVPVHIAGPVAAAAAVMRTVAVPVAAYIWVPMRPLYGAIAAVVIDSMHKGDKLVSRPSVIPVAIDHGRLSNMSSELDTMVE
jgi:hypothetical protein